MADPCADARWLTLLRAPSFDLLCHTGTGEYAQVEGGRHHLEFDADGYGSLHPAGGGDAVACQDLLQQLVYAKIDCDGNSRHYAMHRDSEASVWLDELGADGAFATSVTLMLLDGPRSFPVYVTRLPQPHRVFWSLPFVVDAVLGDEFDGSYICRHRKDFVKYMAEFGVGSEHLRTSFWARLKQAASADEAVQPEEQQEHEQEWTVTTSGLIAILLAWNSFKGKVKHGHDKTSAIIGLLTGLVRFFLPMGPGLALQVGTLDEPLGSIEVANRRLDLTALGRHGGAEGLKKKLAPAGSLAGELLVLGVLSHAPSKSPSQASLAVVLAPIIISALSAQVESAVGGDLLSGTVLDVKPLFRAGSNKARRVSIQYKLDVCRAVAMTEVRSAQQLLASKSAGFAIRSARKAKLDRRKKSRADLSAKTGAAFKKVRMQHYKAKGKRVFSASRFVGIVLDGLRVGGAELIIYDFEDLKSKQSMWLPPQAYIVIYGSCRQHLSYPKNGLINNVFFSFCIVFSPTVARECWFSRGF
jgi:hypothetical protein